MISRLTLNLRMYDPTASNELTFQIVDLGSLRARQHTSTAGRRGWLAIDNINP